MYYVKDKHFLVLNPKKFNKLNIGDFEDVAKFAMGGFL